MTEVGHISLENEMDLIVAHKRMVSVADYLRFTIVTQTTLATAVVEAGREVIDKTNAGQLTIGVISQMGKYYLCAKITFPTAAGIVTSDEGLAYARKLVPAFDLVQKDKQSCIEMLITIPQFVKLNNEMLKQMKRHFNELTPTTPYELLKQKNQDLNRINLVQDEQLRHSHYLNEKKSEFISIASHELKTPLTSIKAYTQLALKINESESSNNRVQSYLEKIDAQASKLQRLIQQLLDVSTIESGKLDYKVEDVVLTDFIQEIVGMLRPILPNHILHYKNTGLKEEVNIDRLRMEQVFINLLTNAAKYSQPGSNIYISITLDAGLAKITIKDEGIGMSKENLEKIFQKFFREKQAIGHYSGMGVGLYITHNIIAQHGGHIWAESEQEKGSSFHFTLPLSISPVTVD